MPFAFALELIHGKGYNAAKFYNVLSIAYVATFAGSYFIHTKPGYRVRSLLCVPLVKKADDRQGAHLAGGKVEIDILDSFQPTEMTAQISRRQQTHGSHLMVRRRNSPTSPCGANRVSATRTRPAISI